MILCRRVSRSLSFRSSPAGGTGLRFGAKFLSRQEIALAIGCCSRCCQTRIAGRLPLAHRHGGRPASPKVPETILSSLCRLRRCLLAPVSSTAVFWPIKRIAILDPPDGHALSVCSRATADLAAISIPTDEFALDRRATARNASSAAAAFAPHCAAVNFDCVAIDHRGDAGDRISAQHGGRSGTLEQTSCRSQRSRPKASLSRTALH